jgi:hypothetical protein
MAKAPLATPEINRVSTANFAAAYVLSLWKV